MKGVSTITVQVSEARQQDVGADQRVWRRVLPGIGQQFSESAPCFIDRIRFVEHLAMDGLQDRETYGRGAANDSQLRRMAVSTRVRALSSCP
jgi:hypothetical protein